MPEADPAPRAVAGLCDDRCVLVKSRQKPHQPPGGIFTETALEQALRSGDKDAKYPPWSDLYARDVVSRQSHAYGSKLTNILLDTLPAAYMSDPAFDFGVKESSIDLVAELKQHDPAKHTKLDQALAELMGNFGAHSRNLVRGVLKASSVPK